MSHQSIPFVQFMCSCKKYLCSTDFIKVIECGHCFHQNCPSIMNGRCSTCSFLVDQQKSLTIFPTIVQPEPKFVMFQIHLNGIPAIFSVQLRFDLAPNICSQFNEICDRNLFANGKLLRTVKKHLVSNSILVGKSTDAEPWLEPDRSVAHIGYGLLSFVSHIKFIFSY